MVSRTYTYNKIVQINLALSNSWQQHVRMEKLAENDLTYVYFRHVVIDQFTASDSETLLLIAIETVVVMFDLTILR